MRLHSLRVWHAAANLARSAYRLTMVPPLSHHYALASQIRRSASAIPANLAEGYGLSTRSQMVRCARIALGSAYELEVHLALARDLELVTETDYRKVSADCGLAIRLLIGLVRGLGRELPS